MSNLKQVCDDYMEFLASDDYNEDRLEHYTHLIFEEAIMQELGDDIFTKINSLTEEG